MAASIRIVIREAVVFSGSARFAELTAASGLVLLVTAALPLPRGLSLFCFGMAGLAFVWWLAWRVTRDGFLVGVIVTSYLVRSALAVALYEISAWGAPIFRQLQLGGGFWTFAPDASYYHDWAVVAATALRAGLELPYFAGANDFPFTMLLLYRLFGLHPLYPVFISIVAMGVSMILGYVLSREVFGGRSRRAAVVLIGFWPSLILWSTQMLKESLIVLLALGFLFAFQRFQRSPSPQRLAWVLPCGLLLFLSYRFRLYVAAALLLATMVMCATKGMAAVVSRRAGDAIAQGVLIVAAILVIFAAASVRPNSGSFENVTAVYRRVVPHLESVGDTRDAARLIAAITLAEAGDRRLGEVASTKRGMGLEMGKLVEMESAVDSWTSLLKLSRVESLRRGFMGYNPASAIDAYVRLDSLGAILRYLPKAVLNAIATPNPFNRFAVMGATGELRRVAMIEIPLVVIVCCLALYGAVRGFRFAPALVAMVGTYAAFLVVLLGLTVPLVGILFRLRLAFVIPLCLLVDWPRPAMRRDRAGR